MKLSFLISTIAFMQMSFAHSFAQYITLKKENTPLTEILHEIKTQSGYHFFWKGQNLESFKVSVSIQKADIKQTMNAVLKNLPFEYAISKNTVIIRNRPKPSTSRSPARTRQQQNIRGTVMDEDGQNLPGATIRIKGIDRATIADANGRFQLQNIATDAVLIITYTGYLPQEIEVNGQTQVEVIMIEDRALINDVVVVAYGTATRQSIPGAVSTVGSEEIAKRPITSVTSVLEGAAPGIQVNNTYGEPGASGSVRLRGFASINGDNSPLYVLDGVIFGGNISDINPNDIDNISVLKDATSAALYGNKGANGVIMITTKKGKKDRVTMNVNINQGVYNRGLAEYDLMGADDFMETMWTGYRNYLMTTAPTTYPTAELANTKASNSLVSDYLKYNIYNLPDDGLFDANGKLLPNAGILAGYDDLDWHDYIERLGYRQDYTLSGGGGSDMSRFYFSGGYLDEKGYIKRSDFKRFTGRLNGEVTPKDWITAGFSISGSHQISNYNTGSASNATLYVNPFFFARNIAPIYPVYLHDMATGEYLLDETGGKQYDGGGEYSRPQYTGRHVIWENELDMDRTFRNTLIGQAYTDIRFLKDFTFTLRGDLNVRGSENRTYNNAVIGDGQGNNGRAKRVIYRYKNYTFQQQLYWDKTLNDDHHLDILLGHENYSYNYNYLYGYKTTETFAGAPELVNFSEITSLTDYQNNYRTESYLSRVRYNYRQKYFAEGSYRRDGSSRFHPDNRWGDFWSIGGSWIISKEDFMEPLRDKINYLKFRTSYGGVGNDESADYYSYMALYTIQKNGGLAALYKSQNEADNLGWETNYAFGAGFEGRLFDRVNFVLEYFDRKSDDLIFDVNLPLSAGATTSGDAESVIKKNIGSASNRGIEVSFDVDAIRKGDLTWNVGLNATFMKSKILRLPEENRENGIINGTKKLVEGRSIYDFWMYQFVGVDQMTGNALYVPDTEKYNLNGSAPDQDPIPDEYLVQIGDRYYTTYTTYGKRDWSGSAIPDVYGSFNTALSWKNFSLSALLTYSLGSKVIDYSYQSLMSMSGTPSALHQDLLRAWSGVPAGMTENSPNRIDPNSIPVVDFERNSLNTATSTQYLKDGSYMVIKNIALQYRLPASIANRLNVNGLSFSASIENLATFTTLKGMNPQQSFAGTNDNAFVTPRIFSFGLNLAL